MAPWPVRRTGLPGGLDDHDPFDVLAGRELGRHVLEGLHGMRLTVQFVIGLEYAAHLVGLAEIGRGR
jgi:hypothetical protein